MFTAQIKTKFDKGNDNNAKVHWVLRANRGIQIYRGRASSAGMHRDYSNMLVWNQTAFK